MIKRLLRSGQAQAAAAWMLGHYLHWALATTTWTVVGEDHFAPYAAGRPLRRRLLARAAAADDGDVAPRRLARWRLTRMHVLVSRHRDGRFIGDIIPAPAGSASSYGSSLVGAASRAVAAGGVRALLEVLAQGGQVAITPDGPRGPPRQAAAGLAQIAGLGDVPVLPSAPPRPAAAAC